MESYQDKIKRLFGRPELMDEIFAHVANGGDLITLSENYQIKYNDLADWIRNDTNRCKRLGDADHAAGEWVKRRIINEIKRISLVDMREIYNEDGSLKEVKDWPEDLARSLASVEVDDLYEGVGKDRKKVGYTKKIKLIDKLKALELLGKQHDMFVQRHSVKMGMTLEELVGGSYEAKPINPGEENLNGKHSK